MIKIKIIILILNCCFIQSILFAQFKSLDSVEKIDSDTSTYQVKTIVELINNNISDTNLYINKNTLSLDSLYAWKKIKGFEYTTYLDSLLKAQRKSTNKKVAENLDSSKPSFFENFLNSNALKILLTLAAVSFVLFIMYKLFLADGIFERSKKNKNIEMPQVVEEEISHKTNFDKLINEAIENNNYRKAIRYQYLKSMHILANKNIIKIAADKTNYEYVQEIKNADFKNEFAKLTLHYEYVWYGEFIIEENNYNKIGLLFKTFNQHFL